MKTAPRTAKTFRKATIALIAVSALALGACTSNSPKWSAPGSSPGAAATATGVTAKISSPASDATGVPAGTAIAYTSANAAKTTVTLTDASGKTIDGAAGYDASTWVPAKVLAYDTKYTAKVTATGADGKTATSTTSFTTMPKPSKVISVKSFLGDHMTYGIAIPVVLTFSHPVASSERAAIQKRLTVTSTPAQTGIWNWISDHEVHYRPKAYWEPGTKFFVDVQTGGVPMGNGYYGRNDLTVDASITDKAMSISTDDKTHMLTVTVDGKVVKRMPASLGKASTPSSSGEFVIMTRKPQEVFDSALGTGGIAVGQPGHYKELVYFTMRLTWGGQFIHAAPWSVAAQGHRDVSHGCTNISKPNAQWIYENSLVGTPVTVSHTTRKAAWGDGWTDWNVSWDAYVKGSALPVA